MATNKTTTTKKVAKKAPKKVIKKVAKKTAPKKAAAKVVSLKFGQTAPDFTIPTTDGGEVTLSKLRGQKVVLYFYPKDMTQGCTVQAHEFSAIAKKYAKAGVQLFGISPDSIESHYDFIARDSITYPLLADVEHKVADAYGVWVEKSMYGKKYMGIERSTFVIDSDGKLEAVYHKVKPEGHALCVLEDIKK